MYGYTIVIVDVFSLIQRWQHPQYNDELVIEGIVCMGQG